MTAFLSAFPRSPSTRAVDGECELFTMFRMRHQDVSPAWVMAVEIRTEPEFGIGTSRALFEDPLLTLDYDVSPDGERFYMIRESESLVPTHITVVLNWTQELDVSVFSRLFRGLWVRAKRFASSRSSFSVTAVR